MVLIRMGVLALMVLFLKVDLGFCQNSAEQIWSKGVELAAKGKFIKAKEEFEKVLKVDPLFETAERFLKLIEDVNHQTIKAKNSY